MSLNHIPDRQCELSIETFVVFLEELEKKGNDEKVKRAKQIFTDTYYEGIQGGMNSQDALQRAVRVTHCFLIETKM
jgi:hypothetical protein